MSRLVIPINTAFPLVFSWYDTGGVLDANVDAVNIAINDANSDVVLASTAMTDVLDGTYTHTLAAVSAPAHLYATLTDATAATEIRKLSIEVVGNELFDEFTARNRKIKSVNPLSDTAAYSDALIRDGRTAVMDLFEERTGRSFVRRYARVELSGDGGTFADPSLGFVRSSTGERIAGPGAFRDIVKVTAASIGGTALTLSDIKLMGNGFHLTSGTWTRATASTALNVVIEYEYGMDPTPMVAQEAALMMLFANIVPSDVASRATSMNNEDGTFRLTTYPRTVEDFLRVNDMRGLL